jgi:hypothetical protein
MPGQIRIRVRFNQWVGQWFDYLLVSAPEMAAILDGTGWAVDQVITGEDPCYVAVIRRV